MNVRTNTARRRAGHDGPPTTLSHVRWLLVLTCSVLVACGNAHARTCACDHNRFHGATGIRIPRGQTEPSWWIDPVVNDHAAEPQPGHLVSVDIVVPSDTLFAINSGDVNPSAETALDVVHASLDGDVILGLDLDCHADSTGDPSANQTLSEHRAASLGLWIATHWHVTAERLIERGHGDRQPIATNDTPTGRAQNRRCTITVALQRRR